MNSTDREPSSPAEENCSHSTVQCLNEYELIRKYTCDSCGAVMMCACDEDVGRRFRPHQLHDGTDLHTQERIPVTLGFVRGVCRECRGLPPQPHPRAEIHGQTGKVRRYYWREIEFETLRRLATYIDERGGESMLSKSEERVEYERIAREVLADVKRGHDRAPKYIINEESQESLLRRLAIETVPLRGTFAPSEPGKRARLVLGGELLEPELFVARHFERSGFEVLKTESRPFHVLFGIYMWLLIQDPGDERLRLSGFGSRSSPGEMIWTLRPEDFGTSGYAARRAAAIERHVKLLLSPDSDFDWLFDYWLEPSAHLREYLWAHAPADIEMARRIMQILPRSVLVTILRYLVGDYWRRYVGWPDLLLSRAGDILFVEVKASSDRLSLSQRDWIAWNSEHLHLPFKIVRIHRERPRGSSPTES
jgi:hypothetical protein